jgi:hypothetical protein
MHLTLALNGGRPRVGARFRNRRPDATASYTSVRAALQTGDRIVVRGLIRTVSRDRRDVVMAWLQLALVVGPMGVAAIAMRRRRDPPDAYADIDVGTVSENWLAEQRGRKE